jgi:hypothetical protein
MKPAQQLALIDKVIRELEDLKNSQTAVLKKISQIEADNINLGSDLLNDGLPGIHEEVDDAVQKITALIEPFTDYRNQFEKEHPVTEEAD